MVYLVYFTGVVFILTTLWLWNGSLERNDKVSIKEKEDNKVGILMALTVASLSWASVVIAIIMALIGVVIYALSVSNMANKLNLWFKQES